MSCSLYSIELVYDTDIRGHFIEISNPLFSVNHADKELLDFLNISSQLGKGDKLIVLKKEDIHKAYISEYFEEDKLNLKYLLDAIGNQEFGIFYVDGI